ncbi:ion transporter [Pseudogemmatithrix spongiicola]|uniref:Ion transporter n=1 Tax=Pseudogemmatithrix spongiicola TaxID=3062599 RepID=A0AA49JXL3_9BACT|nr:ion transporter [Gemmatimonadaceae bacterium 'strain 138']WKW13836.1 ion transporter [Gemmatimonadaceae bacterium 'strain 318']
MSETRAMDPRTFWRRVIFDHDTRAGRAFDVALIVAILGSVITMLLDSMPGLPPLAHRVLYVFEWLFTLLFTAEYVTRLWCAADRLRYAKSFYGVIDLLAVLPTWIALVLPESRFLGVIRIIRVLRIFRILKLTQYVAEASMLTQALVAARYKIVVFMFTIVTAVSVVGSLMYLIEGPEHGFTSIPTAMYWAIVTMTTVGYGDISPGTPFGRLLASALMILGYGIIAVPTGIVTMELQRAGRVPRAVTCPRCGRDGHDLDAVFCKACGTALPVKGVL